MSFIEHERLVSRAAEAAVIAVTRTGQPVWDQSDLILEVVAQTGADHDDAVNGINRAIARGQLCRLFGRIHPGGANLPNMHAVQFKGNGPHAGYVSDIDVNDGALEPDNDGVVTLWANPDQTGPANFVHADMLELSESQHAPHPEERHLDG